jgi:hypothetical protein
MWGFVVLVEFFGYAVPLWAFFFLLILVFLAIWLVIRFALKFFLIIILVVFALVVLDMLGVLHWIAQYLHL